MCKEINLTRNDEQKVHYLIKIMSEIPVFEREDLHVYIENNQYEVPTHVVVCKNNMGIAYINFDEEKSEEKERPNLDNINVDLEKYMEISINSKIPVTEEDFEQIKTKLENDICIALAKPHEENQYKMFVAVPQTKLEYHVAKKWNFNNKVEENKTEEILHVFQRLAMLTLTNAKFSKYKISNIGMQCGLVMRYVFSEKQVFSEVCVQKEDIGKIIQVLDYAINSQYIKHTKSNTPIDFETRLSLAKKNFIANPNLAIKYMDDFVGEKLVNVFANSPTALSVLRIALGISKEEFEKITYGNAMQSIALMFNNCTNTKTKANFTLTIADSFTKTGRMNRK